MPSLRTTYRRFAAALAGSSARLGADADRYSFIVSDFHRLLSAGLPAHCEKLWTLPDTAVFTGADMDQPRNLAKLVTME